MLWSDFEVVLKRLNARSSVDQSKIDFSDKYEKIVTLLERLVRPRALESVDFEGVFLTLDINEDGHVEVQEYVSSLMTLLHNNAIGDRQLLIKMEKMLRTMAA